VAAFSGVRDAVVVAAAGADAAAGAALAGGGGGKSGAAWVAVCTTAGKAGKALSVLGDIDSQAPTPAAATSSPPRLIQSGFRDGRARRTMSEPIDSTRGRMAGACGTAGARRGMTRVAASASWEPGETSGASWTPGGADTCGCTGACAATGCGAAGTGAQGEAAGGGGGGGGGATTGSATTIDSAGSTLAAVRAGGKAELAMCVAARTSACVPPA